ncbi:MAG: rhodanese-like domain-containing protein [Acidimicrobiia bacterium]
MQIHEFVDEGLGHSSYVIDLDHGTAAIVDPPRFPIAHEQLADTLGLRIVWTIDTHSHADYVTGSPGLVARRGAVFVAPAASRLASPHRPVVDGEVVELAPKITSTALATPGHTPDHHAYVLTDHGRVAALFSGGSLMVGTVGRTDLCGPDLAVPLAHEMFQGLRRFDTLPGTLAVYPTHGAGSFCSAPGASQRTSTLGHERDTNPLFSIGEEDQFVEQLVAGFGTFPTYFARLPELNRLGPARYDTLPTLAALTPDDVEQHLAAGGVVVDARPAAAFSSGHVPGSLSNTLRPVFASWLGWLVEPDQQLVFVLDPGQDRADLVRQCLDVGHEHLVGELAGGIDAWTGSGRQVNTIPFVDAAAMVGGIIDVRQANEYATGHVPGSRNVELGQIAMVEPRVGPVTVMCGHGERAMTGASLLVARGDHDVVVLDGGPDTWSSATGRPLAVGA